MSEEMDVIEFNQLSLEEKAFLYCAGVLDSTEQGEIRTLLDAADSDAMAALVEAEALLGDLPHALDAVAPSPGAEEALLARIRTEGGEETIASVTSIVPRQRRAARWGTALAWAAGITLILGGSLSWVARDRDHAAQVEQLALEVAEEREETDQYRARIAELEMASAVAARRVESLEAHLAQAAEQVIAAGESKDEARGEESVSVPNLAAAELKPSVAESALKSEVHSLRQELRKLEGLLADREKASSQELASASLASREIEGLEGRLAASQAALELVRAPDVGVVDLFSPGEEGVSSASVFWDQALRHCYLHVRALPSLNSSDRYALWLEYEQGRVIRVSDFRVDAKGDAEFFEDLPVGKGEIIRTFVTRERSSDAVTPSDAIVLSELRVAGADRRERDTRRRYRRRTL